MQNSQATRCNKKNRKWPTKQTPRGLRTCSCPVHCFLFEMQTGNERKECTESVLEVFQACDVSKNQHSWFQLRQSFLVSLFAGKYCSDLTTRVLVTEATSFRSHERLWVGRYSFQPRCFECTKEMFSFSIRQVKNRIQVYTNGHFPESDVIFAQIEMNRAEIEQF